MTTKLPTIEAWPIEKVVPYEANAKVHSQAQVEMLAHLIKTGGWTQPIVVDGDGVIIAGHGRRLAALHLTLKEVPVVCRRDLSKAEADAMRLGDNRVTSTDYDMGLIHEELRRLNFSGVDLTLTGFDIGELDFAISDLGDMGEDAFVEDVLDAVEEQKAENEAKVAAVDDTAAPVVDALGFKRVTIAESRRIRQALGAVQEKTGKTGVAALFDVFERAGV